MNKADIDKHKNVLWLNNHVTACQFECDLLKGLGYNIFVPKYFPIKHRSFAATYAYDADLPLTPDELALLNAHDFYAENWPPAVFAVLNRYFGTAIVACFSEIIYEAVAGFRGNILLRSYGPFNEKATVWQFLQDSLSPGIRRNLAEVGDRFWFSEAYPNLADPEHTFIKQRRVNHPTGIASAIQAQRHTYKRSLEKVLIVLPDIAGGDHQSAEAYPKVKRYFSDIPKVIAGKQSVPVDDPDVAGLIPWPDYEAMLRGCAAMFYHNVNPRHVHYHPVEAACFGMPVIFMARGMLGVLGSPSAPGACRTYKEATSKLSRILKGDQAFIRDVIDAQKPWVDYFMSESNRTAWEKEFSEKIIGRTPLPERRPRRRLALIFFAHSGPFFPEFADWLARSYRNGVDDDSETPEIVIALPNTEFGEADAAAIEAKGWKCRLFHWQTRSRAEVMATLEFSGRRAPLWSDHYLAPRDVEGSLSDCDGWIVVVNDDHPDTPIAPIKPIVVVVRDHRLLIPNHSLRELTLNACAVAVLGNPPASDLSRLGLDQLNCFPSPTLRSEEPIKSARTGEGPILVVLPKAASSEELNDLYDFFHGDPPARSTGRDFVVVLDPGAKARRDTSASPHKPQSVQDILQTIVSENRRRSRRPEERVRKIDVVTEIPKIRAAVEACSGAWCPFGVLPELGLLVALRERNIPIVCPPCTGMETLLETLGLDYMTVKLLNIMLLDDAFDNLCSPARSSAKPPGPTDCIDPHSFFFTWTDVVTNL